MLISRGAGLIETELDDEIVGINIDSGAYYRFNPTAARIWKMIEQPQTLAELCAALAGQFEVDPAECEADVRALLDDLAKNGLVTLS